MKRTIKETESVLSNIDKAIEENEKGIDTEEGKIKRQNDWYEAKRLFNIGKRNEATLKVQKMIGPIISSCINPIFKYPDNDNLYWEILSDIMEHFPAFNPLYLTVTDDKGRRLKITKALKAKVINEDTSRYLLIKEEEMNKNLDLQDDILNEISNVFRDIDIVCFRQTGFGFCKSFITKNVQLKDCFIKNISRSDRDRIRMLDRGESESKVAVKQSTIDTLKKIKNSYVPVCIDKFEELPGEDDLKERTPKELWVPSAEDAYITDSEDISCDVVEQCIDIATDIAKGKTNLPISKRQRYAAKKIFLIEVYKSLGFDMQFITSTESRREAIKKLMATA